MIDTHLGVALGIFEGDAAQFLARTIGKFRNEEADHLADVFFRACKPVLHGEEIGANILRGSGNETQDLGQPLQHGQLLFAGGGLLGVLVGLGAAQFLQQVDDGALAAAHGEAAHAGELDHLTSRHEAHQRIASVAPGGQRRHHCLDVVFHEQHGGNDDVGPADLVDAMGQRIGIGTPVGGRVDGKRKARNLARQLRVDARNRPRQVIVECDDHHAAGRFWRLICCNGLWHRTASRW